MKQLCPKCKGQGTVSKPPYIPGDVHRWDLSTSSAFVCNLCNGAMVIESHQPAQYQDALITELWSLWESMAECGELKIGPKFSANYERLKKMIKPK